MEEVIDYKTYNNDIAVKNFVDFHNSFAGDPNNVEMWSRDTGYFDIGKNGVPVLIGSKISVKGELKTIQCLFVVHPFIGEFIKFTDDTSIYPLHHFQNISIGMVKE